MEKKWALSCAKPLYRVNSSVKGCNIALIYRNGSVHLLHTFFFLFIGRGVNSRLPHTQNTHSFPTYAHFQIIRFIKKQQMRQHMRENTD